MEIGSEFWISKIPNKYLKGTPKWINLWGNNVLTSSGRGAISLMLEVVEEDVKYKTALIPAYVCESVIMPFIRKGYTCYFYDVDQNLEPNYEAVNMFTKQEIGIFLHMGYYGFPTNDKLQIQIREFKQNGTIIMEDLTHTLFSKYKRYEENDYYVGSLRKWFGLPSGGFLASKNKKIKEINKINRFFSSTRKEALMMKRKYIKTKNEQLKTQFLKMFKKAEEELNNDSEPYCIDEVSNTIILNYEIDKLVLKRRENFAFLSKQIKGIKGINTVFDGLPDGICPFFFPIYIERIRNKLRKFLIEEKIYCSVHWPLSDKIEINNFKNSLQVYNTILSIPCDQRYAKSDMERIVSVLKAL